MPSGNKISRRTFLQAGAAAVASFAAPAFIPASALGRDGSVAPSERITMGFIGVGGQGGGHLLGGAWTYLTGGYAARPDVQVLAVCDVWRDRRENAKQRVNQNYADTLGRGTYHSCEAYTDFREVISRPDIDAVLIASPAHWHAIMSTMALRAGKDVYCEKPTACTIAESKAVRDAVRRYGRVYQAGTQQRSEYNGLFRRTCEFVRSGRIGTLKEIYCHRDGGAIAWHTRSGPPKPRPAEVDWDLYLGPAPELPYDGDTGSHRFDIGELNWGQHHYDIIQWGAAADDTGPVELWVENGRSCYRYASGVTVYGRPHPEVAIGEEGGATFVGTDGRISVDRNTMGSFPGEIIRTPLRPEEEHLYHATSHSENFLECVRTRRKPICDADTAHRSASALLLGGIVKQLGRRLHWDPAKEQFLNDDEANRMLSMATRAPWQV